MFTIALPELYDINFISCSDLFNMIQDYKPGSMKPYLILDVRDRKFWDKSRINVRRCVNIEPEWIDHVITGDKLVSKMKKAGRKEELFLYSTRNHLNLDHIVLLDWGTTPSTLEKTNCLYIYYIILILKDITNWPPPIVILHGGYKQWLQEYPELTTNPRIILPDNWKNPEINKPIHYPKILYSDYDLYLHKMTAFLPDDTVERLAAELSLHHLGIGETLQLLEKISEMYENWIQVKKLVLDMREGIFKWLCKERYNPEMQSFEKLMGILRDKIKIMEEALTLGDNDEHWNTESKQRKSEYQQKISKYKKKLNELEPKKARTVYVTENTNSSQSINSPSQSSSQPDPIIPMDIGEEVNFQTQSVEQEKESQRINEKDPFSAATKSSPPYSEYAMPPGCIIDWTEEVEGKSNEVEAPVHDYPTKRRVIELKTKINQAKLESQGKKLYSLKSRRIHEKLEKSRDSSHLRHLEPSAESIIPIEIKEEYDIKILEKEKSVFGTVGLENPHNLCYANSIVQCLSNIGTFRDYFLNLNEATIGNLSKSMTLVMKNLWKKKSGSMTIEPLKDQVAEKKKNFNNSQQQDCQEFLVCLFELLHDELKEDDENMPENQSSPNGAMTQTLGGKSSIISETFYGETRFNVTCNDCGKQSKSRFEVFSTYLVDLPKGETCDLNQCILDLSNEQESNRICCKCKKKNTMEILEFAYLPKTLIIHLNRFSDLKTKNRIKVDFSMKLKMNVVTSSGRSKHCYFLQGISCHRGLTMSSGHYVSYCKNLGDNKWYKYNDTSVTKVEEHDVLRSHEDPYLLFYSQP